MRRMLDPKEAGGSLPSTITFDQEGNRTVGKNLEVDGKLKLKSLVSASNPDGDITKELGGGGGPTRNAYSIFVRSSFHYEVYTTTDLHLEKRVFHQINDFLTNENYKEFHAIGKYPAAGYINDSKSNNIGIISQLEIMSGDRFFVNYFNIPNSNEPLVSVPLNNQPFQIIQLY